MSHTDKTRPDWVQVTDPHNKGWLTEEHNHHLGPCDIEPLGRGQFGDNRAYLGRLQEIALVRSVWRARNRGYRCFYWYSSAAYHSSSLWPRTPRTGRSKHRAEKARDGRARMELRRLRREWCGDPYREDIDSTEALPTQRLLAHKWRD